MAEKKEETKKSRRHLFHKDNGLPIMVNLYVIKYIYYHIEKANRFMEKQEKGKKPKAYPIYQNELPISRQRFDRINKGITFEISTGEAGEITSRFGIGEEYFRKDSPVMFKIKGISERDWKEFYCARYKVKYKGIEEEEACAEKVERALKGLISADWKTQLKPNDPLFAICYYFSYGKKKEERNRAEIIIQLLKDMNYRDWEQSGGLWKEAHGLLEKHYRYTDSIRVINDLREEQEKQKEQEEKKKQEEQKKKKEQEEKKEQKKQEEQKE